MLLVIVTFRPTYSLTLLNKPHVTAVVHRKNDVILSWYLMHSVLTKLPVTSNFNTYGYSIPNDK